MSKEYIKEYCKDNNNITNVSLAKLGLHLDELYKDSFWTG